MSRLIVFEGVEGSGKTTQAQNLVRYLESRKIPVVYTKEPGGTPTGIQIRKLLLDPDSEINDFTELYLYLADRAQHVYWIREQISQGITVVCDRMFLSTLAYQGYGRKLPLEVISQLNKIAMQGLDPDVTFLIDLDPIVAFERMKRRPGGLDRIERESLEFHRRVHRGFLELSKEYERVAIINGELSEPDVAKLVIYTFDHWVWRESLSD